MTNQQPTDPHQPEQSFSVLVLKGVLFIIGAFVFAGVILQMHFLFK
jgi:hypothetical protein